MRLLASDSAVISTQITAADGTYSFAALPAGSYEVVVDPASLPVGVVPVFDIDGIATAHTAAVALVSSENRTGVDFGYGGGARVGDRIWLDANGDGVQGGDEGGLAGVTVRLFDASSVELAAAITDAAGNYLFLGLTPGTYVVKVDGATLPPGLAPTFDFDGIVTAHQAEVTVEASSCFFGIDFGYRGAGSIGDRIWKDTNGNGLQELVEAGINGVRVELKDGSGAVLDTKTTAGDGSYSFTHLGAGSYTVSVVTSSLPTGFVQTFDLDGLTSPHRASLTLAGFEHRLDVDFGYRKPPGGEGCTPGYWKQSQHFDSWVFYRTTDRFNTVFGVAASGNPTLLQALGSGGGGFSALNRHAVAALLNSSNSGVSYHYTTSQVIALVQQAYATNNPEPIKNQLAAQNETGCPLN